MSEIWEEKREKNTEIQTNENQTTTEWWLYLLAEESFKLARKFIVSKSCKGFEAISNFVRIKRDLLLQVRKVHFPIFVDGKWELS